MTPYTAGMVDYDTALEEWIPGPLVRRRSQLHAHEKGCSYFTCHWHLYDYITISIWPT